MSSTPMIVWIIAAVVVIAVVGTVLLWPRSETITYKHTAPRDIRQWAPPKHHADHTSEFSAIPHGANKHFVDETAKSFALSERTDTVMVPIIRLGE